MFLNFIRDLFAAIVYTIPPLPSEVVTWLVSLGTNGTSIMSYVAKLDPIVPFGAINVAITAWVVVLNVWLAVQLVRLVLWVLNR